MTLAFRRLSPDDLRRVNGWIARPHVAAVWDGSLEPQDLCDPHHRLWLAADATGPFAFVQDYDPLAQPGHLFSHLAPGARGMDLFVGEPDRLGGGARLIDAFAVQLFAQGAPVVGADPHPDNARARRAFAKAGFTVAGPPRDSDWGLCLPMTRYAP